MENKTLSWDKIGYHFDESYKNKLKPFVESGEFYKIMEFLTNENKNGKKVLPGKNEIFRVFRETKLEDIKIIFLGMSPYFIEGVADGLSFSCGKTMKEQPSLKILLDSLEDDLGYKDDRNPDLVRWSKQGVFLLNASLSATKGDAKGHLPIWKPFIEYLYKNVFNDRKLIICYFGKDAAEFQGLENKELHKSMVVEHPSYAARQERGLIHKNLFTNVNKWLREDGEIGVKWQEYGSLPFEKVETEEHFLM